MLISIEPLGARVFLPAILLGWELDADATLRIERLRTTLPPPWFLHVMQQAGGFCFAYPVCAGLLLRLEGNKDRLVNPDTLIQGLQCMAEDPDHVRLERDYPLLSRMVSTWGLPYEAATLRALDNYLSQFATLPLLEAGIEAYIHFREWDLLPYFAGWQALQCRLRSPETRLGSTYAMHQETAYYIGQGNQDDVFRSDNLEVNAESLARLADFGAAVGLQTPIRAILMWENSD